MPNSDTEHSRKLRAKTASARKKRIIAEGGHDLRVLLEAECYLKLQAIVESRVGISRRAVVIEMIDREYRLLNKTPKEDKLDQLDIINDQIGR